MKRFNVLASVLGAAAVSLVVLTAPDARACGGCFHEEKPATQSPSVVTDHRMVLAITPTMTTLWDQIEYVGDPGSFAWVLPIRGQVVVGVGSDAFINSLDQQTQPLITAPPSSCPAPVYTPRSSSGGGCGSSGMSDEASSPTSAEGGGGTGWQEDSGVFVTNRSVVGPYETVQVHGKDAGGIIKWLRDNGYHVDVELEPMLQKYVDEGFDFVAVRLRPDVGVNAMRPIRVSFKGAYPSLPLRMVRAGVGDKVGIKLFVIADGRWRTQNFPTQAIDPAMLTWDFTAQRSDYTLVRDREAQKFGSRAFTLEASVALDRASIVFDDPPKPTPDPDTGVASTDTGVATDTGTATDSGTATEAATESGAETSADDAATEAAADDAATEAAADDAAAEAAIPATDTGVATDAAPSSDTGTSMPGYDAGAPPSVDPYANDLEIAWGTTSIRRVTRLRADLPAKALETDLDLEADDSQAELSPRIQVTKGVNEVCASSGTPDYGSEACALTVPDSSSDLAKPLAICAAAIALAFARRRR